MGTREITVYTPTKIYKGHMDVGNDLLRTVDFFNSSNVYWKNPAERSFEDAFLLYDAMVSVAGNTRLGEFAKLQIRLSEIIFFLDTGNFIGDITEKKRAEALRFKTRESNSQVKIITKTRGHSFYYISGTFFGLFKNKSSQRFIPITKVKLTEVVRSGEQWSKKNIPLENGFVGVSTKHIEACTFSDIQ